MIDGNGVLQTIVAPGQEVVTDRSGSITTSSTNQQLLAANPSRSGWYIQNNGVNNMMINELGGDASVSNNNIILTPGSSVIAGGPSGQIPLTSGIINISGTASDTFTAREW